MYCAVKLTDPNYSCWYVFIIKVSLRIYLFPFHLFVTACIDNPFNVFEDFEHCVRCRTFWRPWQDTVHNRLWGRWGRCLRLRERPLVECMILWSYFLVIKTLKLLKFKENCNNVWFAIAVITFFANSKKWFFRYGN